ncbi:hypothetical protein JD501_04665 [Aeromonas hydrophila]|uniref:hypothetical protein n=1 Tax=Aeromonas hydrophila TaxID=644 RepID=UPI00191E570E|nr:hypothetical protein [Aeromonas hydrophila]MBL0432520.1 hypothetical protein [Aeromonas hydrophila]MBL0468491.1 hypothetical protein [Aeromonas hydrophila]
MTDKPIALFAQAEHIVRVESMALYGGVSMSRYRTTTNYNPYFHRGRLSRSSLSLPAYGKLPVNRGQYHERENKSTYPALLHPVKRLRFARRLKQDYNHLPLDLLQQNCWLTIDGVIPPEVKVTIVPNYYSTKGCTRNSGDLATYLALIYPKYGHYSVRVALDGGPAVAGSLIASKSLQRSTIPITIIPELR